MIANTTTSSLLDEGQILPKVCPSLCQQTTASCLTVRSNHLLMIIESDCRHWDFLSLTGKVEVACQYWDLIPPTRDAELARKSWGSFSLNGEADFSYQNREPLPRTGEVGCTCQNGMSSGLYCHKVFVLQKDSYRLHKNFMHPSFSAVCVTVQCSIAPYLTLYTWICSKNSMF